MTGLPIRILLFSVNSYKIVQYKVNKCDLSIFTSIPSNPLTWITSINQDQGLNSWEILSQTVNRNWMNNDGQVLIKKPWLHETDWREMFKWAWSHAIKRHQVNFVWNMDFKGVYTVNLFSPWPQLTNVNQLKKHILTSLCFFLKV